MSELTWDKLRQLVYDRARGCCEYCWACEENMGQIMPVDHIDPHGGNDLENLCLACWNCNSSKHTATRVADPQTGHLIALFNPRQQTWSEHFEWADGGIRIHGITPIGRATVARLKMNRPKMLIARQVWIAGGNHPP